MRENNRLVPPPNKQCGWGNLTQHLHSIGDKVYSLLPCEFVCTIRWIRSTVPEPCGCLFHPEDASSTFHRNVTSTKKTRRDYRQGSKLDKELNRFHLQKSNFPASPIKGALGFHLSSRQKRFHSLLSCGPWTDQGQCFMKFGVGVPAHATSTDRTLSTRNLEITGVERTASLSSRFTPGKEHRYPLKWRLGGSLSRYGRSRVQKNPLSVLVIRLSFVA